ncbi:MAG: class I SAM-dependent methyltransferase, partial [Dehalococcoidia bacterium]
MTTQSPTPDLKAIKGTQQQTWASGDFAAVATTLPIVSEMLCEAVDLHAGERVLDVATGSGNTAIAAARRFCAVAGVDYVPALLERARERAATEGLAIEFRDGDAEAIPYADASFDVVLSTYGSMFAPDQERAARELLRVCRTGGRIGMVNWTPEGFIGEMFRVTGRHVPPPTGLKPPVLWGNEARLRELFGGGISSLSVTRRMYTFRYTSAEHWLDFFRMYYGPTLKSFEALDAAGRQHLAADLLDLARRYNQATDGTLAVPAEYAEVV